MNRDPFDDAIGEGFRASLPNSKHGEEIAVLDKQIRRGIGALHRENGSLDEYGRVPNCPPCDAEAALERLLSALEAAEADAAKEAALRDTINLMCADDFRVNGCACTETSRCYLHGVYIPKLLGDDLPPVTADEYRFMQAAAVEYVRAEAAEADARQAEERIEVARAEALDDVESLPCECDDDGAVCLGHRILSALGRA